MMVRREPKGGEKPLGSKINPEDDATGALLCHVLTGQQHQALIGEGRKCTIPDCAAHLRPAVQPVSGPRRFGAVWNATDACKSGVWDRLGHFADGVPPTCAPPSV